MATITFPKPLLIRGIVTDADCDLSGKHFEWCVAVTDGEGIEWIIGPQELIRHVRYLARQIERRNGEHAAEAAHLGKRGD